VEQQRSTAGQGIGIAGLVLGITAIPLAVVPCTFPLALLFAAGGIILSAVGISQASKMIGAKGMPVAGLVVSIIAMMIALMWGLFIASAIDKDSEFWKEGFIEKISKHVEKDIEGTFEELDKEFEKVNKDLEDVLDDLEWEEEWADFNWSGELTKEELNKVMGAYEELIKNYTTLVGEAQKGKMSVMDEFNSISAKADTLETRITSIAAQLTAEQKARFEHLKQKFETALQEAKKLESVK
jgi:hypothetical protein